MQTTLCFLDEYGKTLIEIPLSVDHWDACELGNTMLSRSLINAADFHVVEEGDD